MKLCFNTEDLKLILLLIDTHTQRVDKNTEEYRKLLRLRLRVFQTLYGEEHEPL